MTPWLLSVWRQPVTTTEASQQDDYDSPWKEAIEIMLADFMAFYFPDAWRAIDWQQPHRFLDQELQKIVPESDTGRRVVDKLVEVALVQGGDQWIHLHIEIQSSRESDFAERMMIYHYRIFDRFRRPVASLAVLADNQPGWRLGPTGSRCSAANGFWTFPTRSCSITVGVRRTSPAAIIPSAWSPLLTCAPKAPETRAPGATGPNTA